MAEPARTRKRKKGPSGPALGVTAVVTLAFGFGVPVFVLAHNASSQSRKGPNGLELTASQQHGRQVFARNCATCHTLGAANAVGRVGPNLDVIIPPIPGKDVRVAFIEDAVTNGRANGNGQMPRGVVDGTDEKQVADFVATAAGR